MYVINTMQRLTLSLCTPTHPPLSSHTHTHTHLQNSVVGRPEVIIEQRVQDLLHNGRKHGSRGQVHSLLVHHAIEGGSRHVCRLHSILQQPLEKQTTQHNTAQHSTAQQAIRPPLCSPAADSALGASLPPPAAESRSCRIRSHSHCHTPEHNRAEQSIKM